MVIHGTKRIYAFLYSLEGKQDDLTSLLLNGEYKYNYNLRAPANFKKYFLWQMMGSAGNAETQYGKGFHE
ncbi:MAG: hypothetical protein D4R55_00545 [Chitinophagaceae bacterium]|nr:MAG: hypothetical protein D4R55_00545 [Chitinophagaceae bacterium]